MLKFHGTPIGGSKKDAIMFLSGRNALFSYFNKGHIEEVIECCDLFVVDNGAFSHWRTTGGTLDIDGYAKFVETYQKLPNHLFHIIPDVIDGTEEQNDKMLEQWESMNISTAGSSSPVFHLGESLDRFDRLSKKYSTVCLGSTSKWPRNGSKGWWELMSEFMTAICDSNGRPKCKLHGLRMLDPRIFTKLPLFSADSTNAAVNGHRCMKEGALKDLERWQGNIRIAQRIEHWQSAKCWSVDNLKQDLFGNIQEENTQEENY